MKALVLAAGFGTRLKPLTDTLPKPLIPVNGAPMILYALALLKNHGLSDIVINLHYKGEFIQKQLGNGTKYGLNIRYSHEQTILGTGGGIRKALPYFGKEDDILVINSDIIVDLNLHTLIAEHQHNQNLATLVLRQHADAKQFGELGFIKNRLVKILDAASPDLSNTTQIDLAHFTGVHILQRQPLLKLPKNHESCIVRHFYQPQLKVGQRIGAHILQGSWHDCGDLKSLKQVEQKLQNQELTLSYQDTLHEFVTLSTAPLKT